jgi:hypothetical protein
MTHEEWWQKVFSKLTEVGKEVGKFAVEVGRELGEKADISKDLAAVELQLTQLSKKKKEWISRLGTKVYTFAKSGKSDILELICGEELKELRLLDEKLNELEKEKRLLLEALKAKKAKRETSEGDDGKDEKEDRDLSVGAVDDNVPSEGENPQSGDNQRDH